jgi:hypothetical protein
MKTATYLRRTISIILTGAAGAVFALVPATATAATSQSFQISPPVSNYSADPGTSVKGTMKVTNLTDAMLSLRTGKENFVAKGEEGEIELVDNADPVYSLAPWFSFDSAQLDIPARSTKELHYTLAVPMDAEPGGRYGSITYSSIPPKLPTGQSGAAVQQTIAAIVFLRINGAAKEGLNIASFGAEQGFYEYGPVKLLARLKNTGNVHEKATGTITIKNMLGMKVDTLKLDEHFVIPGAVRRLHNTWPAGGKKPFMFGQYTATLNATYASGKTITASATFTVLPWKQVLLALIILLVVVVFFWRTRKRFGRAFRILAGRE